MSPTEIPKPENWPGHQGNWGRWPNDAGTLNLVTEEVSLRAAALVELGEVISCSRPVTDREPIRGNLCFEQEMLAAGTWDLEPERTESLNASEKISYRTHGMVNTHLDALAHIGHNGKGFNGKEFKDMVSMEEGVKSGSIANARSIVTRGVFVDIPRARGHEYLEPGDFVRPEEIEAAADQFESGDAAIIRTGATLAPGRPPQSDEENRHGYWQGLHPECVEVLAAHDISVLASDSPADVFPSPYGHIVRSPVHTLTLTYYGIHLLHNMDLELLGDRCETLGRNHFLFIVAPLFLPNATGSLVNPLAIL